jgi:branched-chain amino acid transport system permease protein
MPTVQLSDFEMHYVERGQGDETLVLVAGFISTQRWWRPILERLPAGFRAYALDMRAAGGSEQIESGHTVARYAADVHEFVEAMGLSRFVLVGHSMGGGVAMQYALDHQDRLKALMLVNPLAPYGMRIDQATTDWIHSVQGQAAGQRMMLLGGHGAPPPEEDLEELVADAVAWGKAIYRGIMDDMARFDLSDRLDELKVPTLVTWGDRDRVIPFAGIMDVFTKISGCGLEIWHGVGHHLARERPDWFVELLGRFVAPSGA